MPRGLKEPFIAYVHQINKHGHLATKAYGEGTTCVDVW